MFQAGGRARRGKRRGRSRKAVPEDREELRNSRCRQGGILGTPEPEESPEPQPEQGTEVGW